MRLRSQNNLKHFLGRTEVERSIKPAVEYLQDTIEDDIVYQLISRDTRDNEQFYVRQFTDINHKIFYHEIHTVHHFSFIKVKDDYR